MVLMELDAVEKLESLPGPIVQGVKDVLANPNDRSKMQKLDSLLNQAEAASKSLANLADKVRSSNKKLGTTYCVLSDDG